MPRPCIRITGRSLSRLLQSRIPAGLFLSEGGLLFTHGCSSPAVSFCAAGMKPVPNSRMVADVSLEYAREAMNSMRQQRQIS